MGLRDLVLGLIKPLAVATAIAPSVAYAQRAPATDEIKWSNGWPIVSLTGYSPQDNFEVRKSSDGKYRVSPKEEQLTVDTPELKGVYQLKGTPDPTLRVLFYDADAGQTSKIKL